MILTLTEPTSPRYLYINPENNLVHLLVPVVGGQEISTDNTCKSTASLKEFFGSKGALRELNTYKSALEFDLQFLDKHHPLRQPKKERLNQIKEYIKAMPATQNQYENAITTLMQLPSNLYSIQLRPRAQDLYSRVINPVFNINRENDNQGNPLSALYNSMHQIYPAATIAKPDTRAQLNQAVLTALGASPLQRVDFDKARDALTEQCKNLFGIDIDFTKDKNGIAINPGYIAAVIGVDEDEIATAQDYINNLLGFCAPELFDNIPAPHFYKVQDNADKTEKLSILTQFFLAHLNIYCAASEISGSNFGAILDASPPLSNAVAVIVSSALSAGNPVEESLCTFFNEHSKDFGLTRPLNQDDIESIKQKFNSTYVAITATPENPHMDDFMILDSNAQKGLFVTHQGSICTDFSELDPSTKNEYFKTVRRDFETRPVGEIPQINEHIKGEIDLDINTLLSRLKDDSQFEKLPQNIRDACMQSPAFQARQFLNNVAKGKQDEAHNQLLNNPNTQELLTNPGIFTDYSGRTFNCTAYEYAYWAKDTHMQRMLEQHMEEDTKAQMSNRCEAIEELGLNYSQNGTEYCTKHFDFAPLKQALQNYIDGYDNWNRTNNYDAMKAAWMLVGLAQRDVPVHVINEYCRPDRSFDPTPQFNEEKLPRVATFYNYNTSKDEALFPLVLTDSSGLGVDFALIRVARGAVGLCGIVSGGGAWRAAAALDLAAVSRLDEVRTADLTQSRENLKSVETRLGHG